MRDRTEFEFRAKLEREKLYVGHRGSNR